MTKKHRWNYVYPVLGRIDHAPGFYAVVGSLKIKVAYSRKYGDWAMRELRLVNRLRPRFNSIHYIGKESAG